MILKTFVSCDNIQSSGFILCFFSKNDYKLTQNGGQPREEWEFLFLSSFTDLKSTL